MTVLSYYLLDHFLLSNAYAEFCLINSYYHNSLDRCHLWIRYEKLVWESLYKCSSQWTISANVQNGGLGLSLLEASIPVTHGLLSCKLFTVLEDL